LALKEESSNPKIYEGLAKSLYCTKDFDGAFEAASKAEEINPSSVESRVTRSAIYVAQKRLNEAKLELTKSLEIDPNSSGALCNFGVISFLENKHEDAISYYIKAIEFDPENLQAHRNLSYMYSLKKDYKGALRESWKAFQNKPDFGSLLFIFAMSLGRYGRFLTIFFIALVFLSLVLAFILNNGLLLVPFLLLALVDYLAILVKYAKQRRPIWIFFGTLGVLVFGWLIFKVVSVNLIK